MDCPAQGGFVLLSEQAEKGKISIEQCREILDDYASADNQIAELRDSLYCVLTGILEAEGL